MARSKNKNPVKKAYKGFVKAIQSAGEAINELQESTGCLFDLMGNVDALKSENDRLTEKLTNLVGTIRNSLGIRRRPGRPSKLAI